MADRPLTRDDLDELSDAAHDDGDPTEVAASLLAAASGGRLADPADTGYAYRLAAEIYERVDDPKTALEVASRSVAAYRDRDAESGPARAFRARLLLRVGRDQEAMAELSALRPLLTTDVQAAAYVPEALADGGRTDTAVGWVTEALARLADAGPDHPVVAHLRAVRSRLRESPAGGDTGYADEGALDNPLDNPDDHVPDEEEAPYRGGEAVLLVWPREEYEQVDEWWPEVLEATGATDWDDYRRRLRATIAEWTARGVALWHVTGTADGFAAFLSEQDADPSEADLVRLAAAYGDHLAEDDDARLMPPAPEDPCWCGSGQRYGGCCRPATAAGR